METESEELIQRKSAKEGRLCLQKPKIVGLYQFKLCDVARNL